MSSEDEESPGSRGLSLGRKPTPQVVVIALRITSSSMMKQGYFYCISSASGQSGGSAGANVCLGFACRRVRTSGVIRPVTTPDRRPARHPLHPLRSVHQPARRVQPNGANPGFPATRNNTSANEVSAGRFYGRYHYPNTCHLYPVICQDESIRGCSVLE